MLLKTKLFMLGKLLEHLGEMEIQVSPIYISSLIDCNDTAIDPFEYPYLSNTYCLWKDGEYANKCDTGLHGLVSYSPVVGEEFYVQDTSTSPNEFQKRLWRSLVKHIFQARVAATG